MPGRRQGQMIQPMSLDVVLREYSEGYKAWVIQAISGRYLVVPDNRFPGRRPIVFFKSRYDASRLLNAIVKARPVLEPQRLIEVEVRLLDTLRAVAADRSRAQADSFVILSPNEVSDLISQFKTKAIN
jgi:hypothetical protein